MSAYQEFTAELAEIKENQLERTVAVVDNYNQKHCYYRGKRVLNLISNDYLGIASERRLFREFLACNDDLSAGATASRLLSGTTTAHIELEQQLAEIFQKRALVFNSGYHANTGIIPVIVNSNDIVFCDRLIHASIVDGIRLSGAKLVRYNHLSISNLEDKLKKYRGKYRRSLIITETIFSMDGDIPDLNQLVFLKKQYDSLLMVDEAHSFGLFGDHGYGILHGAQLSEVDVLIGTFGKALGSVGAFIVADECLIELAINRARSFIYSTALPAVNIRWTSHVLTNLLPAMDSHRQRLQKTAQKFRDELKKNNIVVTGSTQIIPIVTGDTDRTIKISKEILAQGFLVLPIRPPTVPKGSCRLRITLNSNIDYLELNPLVKLLSELVR